MDYECGSCFSSDCSGSPAYFDPECPVHGKKERPIDDIRKSIAYFKKLEKDLSQISYDPMHPRWAEKHLAMVHSRTLIKALATYDRSLVESR